MASQRVTPMRTVEWHEGKVRMIDQRLLPWDLKLVEFDDYRLVAQSISNMTVRGAPAIGAAAAFGLALAAYQSEANDITGFLADLETAAFALRKARPTAVNLSWGLERLMQKITNAGGATISELRSIVLKESQRIADQDVAINKRIAEYGAALLKDHDTILHHCNTGALATVDWGTAIGVIRTAHEQGKHNHVLVNETRPRLQGARLTAWELTQYGISFEIIADSAAGYFMQSGEVDCVLVGSDRTAANGDVANKIGTYPIAVVARENSIPFYAVVPTSSVDLSLESGSNIPIEERDPAEVRTPYGFAIFPDNYPVRNPAFDVTPHAYVTAFVTEFGVIWPPFDLNLPIAVSNGSVEVPGTL